MKKLLMAIGMVIAAAGAWPAQADGYRFQFIDYPGAPQTQVWRAIDSGVAVGNGLDSSGNAYVAFQYDTMKRQFSVVPPAPGYSVTQVLGINDFGVMVGAVTSLDGTSQSGFIRGTDGKFKIFRQPGWNSTQAREINNSGLVCGYSASADGNTLVGFIYDPRRNTYTSVLPSPLTIVSGINNRGQIAGSVYLDADAAYPGSPGGLYAFVRNADGHLTYFRVNGQPTRARGINDYGVITGFLDDPTLTSKGFVTKLQGSSGYQAISIPDARLLASPLGGITFAQGITNNGMVSGTAEDAAGYQHGFVAMPGDH